jgi:hypothetical protein
MTSAQKAIDLCLGNYGSWGGILISIVLCLYILRIAIEEDRERGRLAWCG